MKKLFATLLGVILMVSFVFAAGQEGIHEPGTGIDDPDLKIESQGTGQGLNGTAPGPGGNNTPPGMGENGTQLMSTQRIMLQVGNYTSETGEQLTVRQEANNKIKLEAGGKSASSSLKINQEQVEEKTKLSVQLSNGKNAEIKVMPDTASETALERLRLKNCVEEDGCTIELKEVGNGNESKLAYEVKTQRSSRILGLFGATMQVEAQVDAETGEVIETNKPWWAFLATEPEE